MAEPTLFGAPVSLLFLYFVWYSLLGWCMESTYCSLRQRRFINRGFLHLPLCPIYGVGALIMVLFFTPLMGNPFLFYLVATLVMSAWEYFVGWLLEATTHMKYWDYSDRRFNLKGRICLANCLWWGVASYLVIYWVHPLTQRALGLLPAPGRQALAALLAAAILADTAVTIRQLALAGKALAKAEEIRLQLELGRQEFQAQMASRKESVRRSLEARHNTLMAEAARRSHRFVRHYSLSSRRYSGLLAELKRRVEKAAQEGRARKN